MKLEQSGLGPLSFSPDEIIAKTKLEKFDCIHLISHHTFGTGHQRVMYNLICNLARLNYQGPIHLFYSQWKTKLWYDMFGDHPQGLEDYHNHFHTWKKTFRGITISFHPIAMGKEEYDSLLSQFKECMKDTSAEHFWFDLWRDDAPGCELDAFKTDAIVESTQLPKQPYLKFYKHSPLFQDFKHEEIPKVKALKRSTYCPQPVFTENLRAYVKELHPLVKKDQKILTMFAACDNISHFQEVLIPEVIQKMTGATQPYIIIFQPFLWWSKKSRSWPCLVKGDSITYLMGGPPKGDKKVEHDKLVLPTYRLEPNYDILSKIDVTPTSTESDKNKLIQNIITLAREEIELISVYYTEHRSHLGEVMYQKLLDALWKVMQVNPNPHNKPVVIAFLGNGSISSPLPELAPLLENESSLEQINQIIQKKGIVWQSFGRTKYMPLFQQRSLFFVTEGANTWQETITIGKPTLSVNPTGDTQPWNHDWLEADGVNLVKKPSEDLVALALNPKETSFNRLSQFIRDARIDQSNLCLYFRKWSEVLNKQECNQVLAALRELP